jgi:hypothetical protein
MRWSEMHTAVWKEGAQLSLEEYTLWLYDRALSPWKR